MKRLAIRQLPDYLPIRERPGMYIGGTGERELCDLVYELVNNSVNEFRAGHGSLIEVTLLADGACRVRDQGRGIPIAEAKPRESRTLEGLFSSTSGPRPAEPPVFPLACGLRRIGLVAVTALSQRLVVEVHCVGRRWQQEFARGVAVTPLDDVGTSLSAGTTITFWPDPDIFQATQTFSFDALAMRLDELAGLNAGLNIVLRDNRSKPAAVSRSHYPDGLAGFLRNFGEEPPPVHPTILHVVDRTAEAWVEVALRWHRDIDEALYAFANGQRTAWGTHVTGFRSAVTRAVRAVLRRRPEATTQRELPTGDMIRAGLRAAISVNLPQPQFAGATRDRLASPEAEGLVHALTRRCLEAFFREHPDEAEAIVRHALTNPSTNPNCRRPR